MAKKQFKTESKRILDLMVNSIYTHREIFLRELISNASDATDKRYYSAKQTGLDPDALTIDIAIDRAARTLTISDHGCGMTEAELADNLGVIAKSGTLAYQSEHEDIDLIGQFGVGFYAAFMVSETVRVVTRTADAETALCWESSGADGYTITPAERAEIGTDVILTLKPDTEEICYDEFLDPYQIEALVRKYSDYIRYPIQMEMEKHRKKEGSDEYETYSEIETLNSRIPLWKRDKNEVDNDAYNAFYKERFFDFEDPRRVIRANAEGIVSYTALLYLPKHEPMNYYTKEYEKGLALYTNGVLIMERCADLLPDYFGFVRGIVDSQDLSLNISREMLQHDRQLKLIATGIEKKIRSELESLLKEDRASYEEFFKSFGVALKYGMYQARDKLCDLILFASSAGEGMTTLAEYVARMPESQEKIYYACGDKLPQAELVLERGFEVLYFKDDIDEFAIKNLIKYAEKPFQSVSEGDLGLEDETEKKAVEEKQTEHQAMLDAMKEAL